MFQSRYRDLEESDGGEIAYAIKYRRIYFNPVNGIFTHSQGKGSDKCI
jgi:hypothetical protein